MHESRTIRQSRNRTTSRVVPGIASLTYLSAAALGDRWGGLPAEEVADECARHGLRFLAHGLSQAEGPLRAYLLQDIERYERVRRKGRSES